MAESAVQFLLDKVAPLFENDIQLMGGVREEIVYLRGELECMTAFLRVADAFEESDEEVKVWVKQNMKSQYRIAAELQGINLRIRKISEVHRRLRHKFNMAEQGSGSSTARQMWEDHRGDALLFEKTDIVGIDEPIKQMVGWLVIGGSGREVISVAGMGGLGKTTLAKQVYDAAEVKKQFKVSAWITITQSFKLGELLENMINNQLKTIIKAFLQKMSLAIVAVIDVLATKDKRRINEWDMVGHSLGAEMEGNDKLKDLKQVLSLSFNDLPYYLKSCFLLVRLWMAEGFIEAKQGKTLEDVAEDYLNELLNRSMIQVAETTSDGRVKSFRVHDLLREIITFKIRDQNFATIAKEQNIPWPDKVRRLSIHTSLQYIQKNRSGSQLRSLFMFRVTEKPLLQTIFLGALTMLDLQSAPLNVFPVEAVNLFFLKYLSLKGTGVKTISKFIGTLQRGPSNICLDLSLSSDPVAPRQDKVWCPSFLSSHDPLTDGGAIFRELGKLIQLRWLGIGLYLQGRLDTLPHWIPSMDSLVKLHLKWSRLKDNPLVFLQYLPILVHLELSQVSEGDTLCFGAGGFKKLKHLGIGEFDELRCIEVQVGVMSSIEKLSIRHCKSLEKVPSGIEHLNKLKVLELFNMPEKLVKTLTPHEQGNDYWKLAHVLEVYFTNLRESRWRSTLWRV
ncbi:disease resistance protein RPM1-like [Pyrus ussuriensis x Pyrus communis]|uniref:Disease resistance protein RPM1-like n=1 Tax=Pyrus ussuriensis x Pyrus communis TaxID=2448454 RepID=A0A5N5GDI8_9ROSA|nr:disease resistance protein RPM1-like [Pyrus ussuriensis x Pyrus communis]